MGLALAAFALLGLSTAFARSRREEALAAS
jgi:hypothetical protein